ncbi:hypothetical protein NMG60_11019526, partial [Bertholletia excelsa]
ASTEAEFAFRTGREAHQQVFLEDLFTVNGINGVSGEDFPVDVFLDLSNNDLSNEVVGDESEEEEKESQNRASDNSPDFRRFSGTGDSETLAASELALPDDLEDLEWLSEFVNDSVSESSLLCPAPEKTGSGSGNRSKPPSGPVMHKALVPCFSSPVPAKARSKRARPSGQAWSSQPVFVYWIRVQNAETALKRPAKRPKKRLATESGDKTQRQCSHCQVQKTPQWRAGPMGPKTLCNACGVRFKSGRLFPEYRPAGSPTFSRDLHSNSHRKVVEMRLQKEMAFVVMAEGAKPETSLTSTVRGF